MGGLFFLGLFVFGQHEKSVLYFALFCISFSYRLIGSGEYALHALFPDMSWFLLLRAEYFFLFIPAAIFTIYTYSLYPKDGNKYVLIGFSGLCALLAVIVLFNKPSYFSQLAEPFAILLIMMIIYLIYVYWIAFKRKREGSQYAFISTIIMFLVAFYQIVVYGSTVQENKLLTFLGFILFFFFQSLILSYRFAFSLKKAKNDAEAASKAKTEFLSTISHEIRTPLNAVVGISHYLINEKPKKEQIESLESLQLSAEHLNILINDILDYNKLKSGLIEFDFVEVNIKSLVNKIIRANIPVAEEKKLNLELKFDKEIYPMVFADPTRLYQVLNNLINNALKFTSEGFVVIRLIKKWGDDYSQKIRFEVEDSGIGIPEDKKEVIFDRFTQAGSSTTREFGGTGLGLAIIKRILTLFESKIEMESEVGKGTIFSFDLEFKKVYGQKLEVSGPIVNEDNVISGKRILVVEDNRMNIMVAEKFLKKWGMDVDIAMNGETAVNSVKSKKYNLVLMDLQMPIMDGYTATKEIRKFNSNIPIIALTASALLKVQQEVKEAGMDDFLTKPFDPIDLKKKLIHFLNL